MAPSGEAVASQKRRAGATECCGRALHDGPGTDHNKLSWCSSDTEQLAQARGGEEKEQQHAQPPNVPWALHSPTTGGRKEPAPPPTCPVPHEGVLQDLQQQSSQTRQQPTQRQLGRHAAAVVGWLGEQAAPPTQGPLTGARQRSAAVMRHTTQACTGRARKSGGRAARMAQAIKPLLVDSQRAAVSTAPPMCRTCDREGGRAQGVAPSCGGLRPSKTAARLACIAAARQHFQRERPCQEVPPCRRCTAAPSGTPG